MFESHRDYIPDMNFLL